MSNEMPNTSQQLMSDVVTLYTALEEFLVKFSESTTNYSDYTEFNWTDANGGSQTMKIPSIGHLKTDLSEVKQQIEDLIKNNDDKIVLKYGDNSVRTFEMKKISALLDNINQISDTSFSIPTEFKAKSNWMFESFLNPLLYVGINVANFVSDNDVKKFAVRRLILNTPSTNDINTFNANLKGTNNLDYDETITFLKNQGLQYSVDDNEYELASCVNRYSGSFTVLKIEKSTAAIGNNEYPQNYYTLDKLYYTDAINNPKGFTQLSIGNILLTGNDTEYKVKSIDASTNRVLLEKVFGNEPITLGVDTLKIKPEAYRIPELQINIGYNEYEVIFVKPIANVLDLTTNGWSMGFGIYTNELSILLSSNQSIALPEYYNNYVADFGLMMLNFAKEKQIPASLGIKPESPVLNASDYKVEQVNTHIREDKSYEEFKEKIATKNSLKSQIETLNKSINDSMKKLNSSSTQNEQERLSTKKTIAEYNTQKSGIQNQLSTILNELSTYIKSDTNMSTSPKYKIRGFINIPESKTDIYGEQAIVQMVYQYRYKSKSGGASKVNNIPYTDANGNTIQGYFSQWNEHRSDIRKKSYDSSTGKYIWVEEDTQDSDAINFNQLDISITKGEIVEIRVKSISEAGYPLNPIESDWSNTIEIEFPDEFDIVEEDSVLAQRLLIEDALTDFQDDLNARGLELHLSDSVTTGDKYYAHQLENIASGTFTSEGNIINASEYIKSLVSKINALESAITDDEGELLVVVVDSEGNEYKATNGNTVDILAGYYNKEASSAGDIVTKTYKIKISNTSATPLELVSMFNSSRTFIDESTTLESATPDYLINKKYGEAPIVLGGSVVSSNQYNSQFIYSRYKDISLSKSLYNDNFSSYSKKRESPKYNPHAKTTEIHYCSFHGLEDEYTYELDEDSQYSQYKPALFDGLHVMPSFFGVNSEHPELFLTSEPTAFCISKSHPIASDNTTVNVLSFKTKNLVDNVLNIHHSLGIGISDAENGHPIDSGLTTNIYEYSYMQCVPRKQLSLHPEYQDYYETWKSPVKMGFCADDKYLVGKMTCGAYLYMNPTSLNQISVTGTDRNSGVRITNAISSSVEIPITFQFRCTDFPFDPAHENGYIGGYDPTIYGSNLANISYTKIIGFDIYQKLRKGNFYAYDDVFSFDVKITGKYKEDTVS